MERHEPVWILPKEDPDLYEKIINEFRIHPITAQILISRGFTTFEQINHYLYSKLPELHDPKLFLEMDKAVQRVIRAIKTQERILVYGDNDVDGMTGTALLTEFLRKVGGQPEYYVPDQNVARQQLFMDALEFALDRKCTLMITIDCGITAAKAIQKIVSRNIDVIVTDHHEPTDKIPLCAATLNPKLLNQTYPNRELTGVGVAFKLAHGITNYLVAKGEISQRKVDLKSYLDLVALGTVADMGILLDENRILVRYGLKQLQRTKRVGLLKLFIVSDVNPSEVNTIDIATKIAPRMNSLGRIAEPRKGVELLLVRDEQKAEELANELDLFNLERQKIEHLVSADVEKMLATQPELFSNRAIILHSQKWHPGVIPIICARIAKQYNRPTALIAIDKEIGKGSLRTIREFPLLAALKKCSDLLLNFGGHDFAAGLSIAEKNIERFKKRFIHAANSSLKEQDILTKLHIDAHANFKELTYDLLSSLELFEPYGNENPPPILYTEAKQTWPPKAISGMHLKLYLEQDDRMLEGIAFGMAERRALLRRKNLTLKVAYTPHINRFHNKSSIQLLIRDFQVVE